MNDKNGGILGRMLALALILGVAYGVRSIARGGLGCPLSSGGCCLMGEHRDDAAAAPAAADTLANPDAPKNIPAPAK